MMIKVTLGIVVTLQNKESNFIECNFFVITVMIISLKLTQYGLEIWVNIGLSNALLPNGTRPLPEPMLTYD